MAATRLIIRVFMILCDWRKRFFRSPPPTSPTTSLSVLTNQHVDLQALCNRAWIEITNDLPPASKTTRGTGIGLHLTTSLIRAMPGWEFDTEQSSEVYRAIVVAPAA